MTAAGARCKLISTPDSVPLTTFKAKESVVLGWKDTATSPAEGQWLERVRHYLERYVVQLISGYGKFMFCMVHRLQCKTTHFPKRKFLLHATQNVQMHLNQLCSEGVWLERVRHYLE